MWVRLKKISGCGQVLKKAQGLCLFLFTTWHDHDNWQATLFCLAICYKQRLICNHEK